MLLSYDFLTAGPTLVGFVLALWREAPTTPRFLVACQSLLIFLSYLMILLLSRILYFIDTLAQWLPIVDSVLAASYLTITGWLFYRLHTARPVVFGVVSKLWLHYYQKPSEEQ